MWNKINLWPPSTGCKQLDVFIDLSRAATVMATSEFVPFGLFMPKPECTTSIFWWISVDTLAFFLFLFALFFFVPAEYLTFCHIVTSVIGQVVLHLYQSPEPSIMSRDVFKIFKNSLIYINKKIFFSLKRELNFNTDYSMDKSWSHYTKWNKTDAKGEMEFDFTYIKYIYLEHSKS